ncbi:MAG: hypothetical protein H0U59_02610 [Gemmatimonadaceae bacterium]|nr:hypothetical protein [Gemmatimonadaceae bacterium]
MRFYVGLHMPTHAPHFSRCMVSFNVVRRRKKPVESGEWMLDSGAFTEVARNGGFRTSPAEYAETINRLGEHGGLVAAVSQDWMCEPFVVEKTGLSVREHQQRTVERYTEIVSHTRHYVLPVIQGYQPREYASHVRDYGDLLSPRAWVGVGSVCKRSGHPRQIRRVLDAILAERPDLRLHGFGVQLRALKDPSVRRRLWSADSMAWSWNARMQGRDANDWREAAHYVEAVEVAISRQTTHAEQLEWVMV